jgi:hypothetical protein
MRTWIIVHGECRFRFYTWYHAEQYASALRMNGTKYTIVVED